MDLLVTWLRTAAQGTLDGASDGLLRAMVGILLLIAAVGAFSLGISIWLGIVYRRYNRQPNSLTRTGEEIARQLLDEHGLYGIQVTCSGSILFGNSYSRWFKRVRLRRRTWRRSSVSAMAMASQKAMLAVLDYENDKGMRLRSCLMPLVIVGPMAFIPLLLVGVALDAVVLGMDGSPATITALIAGVALYALSFGLSLLTLATERRAQLRALRELRQKGMATEEELAMCQRLFRMYNIEYVNNMVLSLLETLFRALTLVARLQGGESTQSEF